MVRSASCRTITVTDRLVEPPGENDDPDERDTWYEQHCLEVFWPSAHLWSAKQFRVGYNAPRTWMGSLITESRDASGLYYRRNRFYDAETGQFTQEDPIGIAGGLNVYGFANGDPITYSDPFGLAVCFRGTAEQISRLRSAAERATGATIHLNSRNCISHVGQASSKNFEGLRNRLAFLVAQPEEYGVTFGRTRCANLDSHFCQQDLVTRIDEYDDVGREHIAEYPLCFPGRLFRLGPRVTQDRSSILAHELLGHAWAYATGRDIYNERLARRAENVYRRAIGGRERCVG